MFRTLHALRAFSWLLLALFSACTHDTSQPPLGSLSLALQGQAAGVRYRLTDARFALTGPESREFSSAEADPLRLDLSSGAYTLELLPGYRLVRLDDPEVSVEARLVSENPSTLWVEPGGITQVALRFSLADGTTLSNEAGTLSVGIELMPPGQRWEGDPCVDGLKINEVDYDQPGTDTAEFVEVLNTESCDAQLEGVVLEFVSAPDGKVYASYALGAAGSVLKSQERLVVGSALLLEGLPEGTQSLPLKPAGLQNGPDAVRLVFEGSVLDALAYEGVVPNASEGAFAKADNADFSLSRCRDGFDTEDNANDFQLVAPTPGLPNACE